MTLATKQLHSLASQGDLSQIKRQICRLIPSHLLGIPRRFRSRNDPHFILRYNLSLFMHGYNCKGFKGLSCGIFTSRQMHPRQGAKSSLRCPHAASTANESRGGALGRGVSRTFSFRSGVSPCESLEILFRTQFNTPNALTTHCRIFLHNCLAMTLQATA